MVKVRKFAVFDMDGTLMRWQMLHAVFDRLGRNGHIPKSDYDELLEARKKWKERQAEGSFREYEHKVVEIVERNLALIAPTNLEAAALDAFGKYKDQVYRYTRDLMRTLKGQGYFILAVTGVPGEMMPSIAEYYGIDDYVATEHERKDGRYTGNIMVAPLHKPELLKSLVTKHGLSYAGSIGVGDSEGDIALLELVEHPIAFNPTKKLFLHAEKNRWKVVVERKNVMYEFEPKDDHYRLARINAEDD